MAFFDGMLYMTDLSNDGIFSTMSTTQSSITPLILLPDPYSIQVVDEEIQFIGIAWDVFNVLMMLMFNAATNPCIENNSTCSHMCLLSAVATAGYTCICPGDYVLSEDQAHCEREYIISYSPIPLKLYIIFIIHSTTEINIHTLVQPCSTCEYRWAKSCQPLLYLPCTSTWFWFSVRKMKEKR